MAGPRYDGTDAEAVSLEARTPPDDMLRVVSFNIACAREIDRALALLQNDDALRQPDILLPHAAFGTCARRAAMPAVAHRGSLRIRAAAVDLPAPGAVSHDERQEQVRIIMDETAKTADAVVGGDFNGRAAGRWFRDRGDQKRQGIDSRTRCT